MIASGFDRIELNEFYLLKEHVAFVRNHMAEAIDKFENKFKESYEAIQDDEDKAAYSDHMNEEYITLAETFPRLQWYAQFLVVYSTFEHSLNSLCDLVTRRSNFDLKLKDLSGSGIHRSANYLIKVAKVESPFQTSEWNRTILLGKIRNVIAHRNGEMDSGIKDQNELGNKFIGLTGLTLKSIIEDSNESEIVLSAEFVMEAVETLYKVLCDISNYQLYDGNS